ncbi:dihydroxyacetone kinase subunit DhaL [Mycoplana rhizolycopersici]|uniref:Dihydroxyacetone kinase subunit DhaK n=1 Tax=Mycoplana rhizolycopersici TaxID=2746702 RepID=A0ABX2QCH2_9HYPH|nr:dihydroxyacetone kinase subunit DhaL [Rhizobium rhizolycopersici]NVP55435.1 dihydroxyacetone kinase subunit DhaK [Rhizobium rhizolycopersici]
MTIKTKKLINAPDDIIPEFIEGLVGAWPDLLTVEGPTGRAVVARNGPRDGKVGIVIGGGSGHEPAFAGYVGRGLADAAAVGNVFASPSPQQILDAGRAADGGAGVVFLYGNYTGDVLNFTMAAEELAGEGTPVRHVAVTDDIASAPFARREERRGVAGDFFVFKCAGAAADLGEPLEQVEALARLANEKCRSMGVALGACSLPQTGTPNFEIGPEDMEIGMGIHGEPGMRRVPLASADAVVDILMEPILAELELHNGDSVAVLVNGLGATTQLELFVLFRRVHHILEEKGIHIHARWVGEYATSLEMAGASVTILKLDDTLTRLLDHPCRTPALTVATEPAPQASAKRSVRQVQAKKTAVKQDHTLLQTAGSITPKRFRSMMANVAAAIREKRDWLSELDGVIGDGDHGVTMDIGWTAVSAALSELEANATISETCDVIAQAFLTAVGASSGPLYASAFQSAGAAVSERLNLDGPAMAAWVKGMGDGILSRGGAKPGDKTMLDAWVPAGEAAVLAAGEGADENAVLQAATDAARAGRNETATFESRRGRSAKLGARSLGHIDPGAASAALILAAMLET